MWSVGMSKDAMKKAEELEAAFQKEVEKANMCCESCKQAMLKSRVAFEYGYTAALSSKTDKVQILIAALKYVCRVTYGTELCNTDEENNEILARHFFNSADKAREALKAYQTDESDL